MSIWGFLLPTGGNGLEIFFLMAMLVWLSFGLFAAWKAKQRTLIQIKKIQPRKVPLDGYRFDATLKPVFWTYIVENAAGFALIIGLLGTFLGIGLAIEGAGRVLLELNNNSAASSVKDMRATMQNLSPILAEIGMKFKVSAWGIITHIILRCSIPFFKIDEMRQEATSKYIETEYYAVIKEKENFQYQLLQALNRHNDLAEKMLFELEIIAQTPTALEEKIETLSWSTLKFEKTVDDFNHKSDTQLTNLNQNIEYLKDDTLNVLKNIDASVDNVKNEVNHILGESTKDMLNILRLGVSGLDQTNSVIQTAVKNWETQLDYQKINICLNEIENINPTIGLIKNILQHYEQDLNKLVINSDEEVNILQASFGNKGLVYHKLDHLTNVNSNLEPLIIQNTQVQQNIGQSLLRSNHDKKIRLG